MLGYPNYHLKKHLSVFIGISLVLLAVPITVSAQSGEIPSWIKNTASFWANDEISDQEFVLGIQFLITNGIMIV